MRYVILSPTNKNLVLGPDYDSTGPSGPIASHRQLTVCTNMFKLTPEVGGDELDNPPEGSSGGRRCEVRSSSWGRYITACYTDLHPAYRGQGRFN